MERRGFFRGVGLGSWELSLPHCLRIELLVCLSICVLSEGMGIICVVQIFVGTRRFMSCNIYTHYCTLKKRKNENVGSCL